MKEIEVHSTSAINRAGSVPGPRTVLCVDDSADMLEICQTILEADGYRVLTALNGIQALELLRRHKIDAAVVDMIMPGMNGFALAREIKTIFPAILVIMYSSSLLNDEDCPFVDFFLSKDKGPLSLRNLLNLQLQDGSLDSWTKNVE
jgi:two-component system, OmpR family, response regulator